MPITVWNDYICPWAYAARPLTAWLRVEAAKFGRTVDQRSYELHPEIPVVGSPVRPGGTLDHLFDHIAQECGASGLDFVKPSRSPNTHGLLEIMEIVNTEWPEAFEQVDEGFARAHWVTGEALDDPKVLHRVLSEADIEVGDLLELEADGLGARLLAESHALAREVGATGTPAWLVNGMVITGLHPTEQFQRWLGRMLPNSVGSD